MLLDVLGGCAIRISGLHDTDIDAVGEAGKAYLIAQERGHEGGDAVPIQEAEDRVGVFEVEDDTVGIAIEGAATIVGACLGGRWSALVRFDEVGAAL